MTAPLTADELAVKTRQLDVHYARMKTQRRVEREARRQRVAEREARVAAGTTTLEDAWVIMMQTGRKVHRLGGRRES